MKLVFFYDEDERKRAYGGVPITSLDPYRQYLKHYENYLQLAFWRNSDSAREKRRAKTETDICVGKLEFWSGRPGFDINKIADRLERLRRRYNVSEGET